MPDIHATQGEVAPEGPHLEDALERSGSLAEVQGITCEMGELIAGFAEAELEAGRLEVARELLEGLVATNHLDPRAWTLLSRTHRRRRLGVAARLCAEVATRLAPLDPDVRLVRAEALLACDGEREAGRAELVRLAEEPSVGDRATALLAALGP